MQRPKRAHLGEAGYCEQLLQDGVSGPEASTAADVETLLCL